jgi:8-oxo-dGTP pyrophosphatase MutT (NUDIX family)
VTEPALRRLGPDASLRARIEHRLPRESGNGDPDGARIAGLLPGENLARELREFWPKTWARAAVLIPLVERPEGLTVLLTQRSSQLTNHPGQISFPGGRIEQADAGPWEAAIRETEEEIGLGRNRPRLAGYLHDHLVISGYVVTPVVAFVEPGFELRLDRTEVDDTFEAPLAFLLDRSNRHPSTRRIGGHAFTTWDIPWEGRRIWGATAGILVSFAELLEEP